jgi:Ser/Thr protein kinase RdoA (MazF antagonist)
MGGQSADGVLGGGGPVTGSVPIEMTEHERIAADQFGVEGTSSPLPGYTDENAKIVDRNGGAVLLRVSPSDCDPEEIAFCQRVIAATADLEVGTPAVVPTVGGDGWAILDDGRIAQMYTWVDGVSFSEVGCPAQLAGEIGAVAGSMVRCLQSVPAWPRPTGFQWEITDAGTVVRERMASIDDGRHRKLIGRVLDRYDRLDLSALPRQVIHNDLNSENLLVRNDAIVGVIDFGDVVESIRIAELAIACAYAMLDQNDPVSVAMDVIAGYRSVTEPTQEEGNVLLDLILARLATSVAMSASSGGANPHQMASESLAWDLLERLMAADLDPIAADLAAVLSGRRPA